MAQETVPLNQCFHLHLSTFEVLSSPSPWSSSLSAYFTRSGVLSPGYTYVIRTVPYARNTDFIQSEGILGDLQPRLTVTAGYQARLALTGLRGAGKMLSRDLLRAADRYAYTGCGSTAYCYLST